MPRSRGSDFGSNSGAAIIEPRTEHRAGAAGLCPNVDEGERTALMTDRRTDGSAHRSL